MTHEEARREVGDDAVWSLSTAKPGNGVDQLRDSKWELRYVLSHRLLRYDSHIHRSL